MDITLNEKILLPEYSLSPESIFWAVFGFYIVVNIWDFYLSLRQHRIYKTNVSRPPELLDVIDAESFEKARVYHLDKSSFGLVESVYSIAVVALSMFYGFLPYFWRRSGELMESSFDCKPLSDYEITQSLTFFTGIMLVSFVINIPWQYYEVFVIEQRHGFNKQTLGFFIKDKLKAMLLQVVLFVPILSGLIWIVRASGAYFYVFCWLFVSAVTLFLITVYPTWIAPLFDNYVELPVGDLRTRIEALAASLKFPLTRLLVVEGSRRSSHSNAYFFGFWKNKRIVLFDTLIEGFVFPSNVQKQKSAAAGEPTQTDSADQTSTAAPKSEATTEPKRAVGCNVDEVLAVLGHEFGHWRLNHTLLFLCISEMNILLMFVAFGFLANSAELYEAFGFALSPDAEGSVYRPVVIGMTIVFGFVLAPYSEVLQLAIVQLSRRFEFAADRFAGETLRRAPELRSALVKLSRDNLSFPIYDRLYSFATLSHPPLLERIAAIRKFE